MIKMHISESERIPAGRPAVVSANSLRVFPRNIWPFCTAAVYYNGRHSLTAHKFSF